MAMDSTHMPDTMPYVSETIVVAKLAQKMAEDVLPHVTYYQTASMAELLGCDNEVVKELESVCDISQLKCGEEECEEEFSDVIPPTPLVTLHTQKGELARRKENITFKQMAWANMQYRRINFPMLRSLAAQNPETSEPFKPEQMVLVVQLMKPYNRPLRLHEIRLGRLLSLDATFLVLGCNTLAQLRDKITCLSDFAINEDYSNNPDMPRDIVAKDIFKSGFFFIHDTFYNDMREMTAEELSQNIIDWASKSGRLGPFKTARMETTFAQDLTLRMGEPYLYLHQGTCEHLMVMSEIRLLDRDDCQNFEEYPLQISFKPKRRMGCCACKLFTAKWTTYGYDRLPFDSGFFCDECFRSFCYDADGKKIGDFKAVPYYDRQGFN